MILVSNETSTVLAGAWNLAVLSPEWIRVKLLNNIPSIKVQFSIGIDSNYRVDTDDVYISTTSSKIVIGLNSSNISAQDQMCRIANQLIDLWPFTPLHAIGFNFQYNSEDEEYDIPTLKDDSFLVFNGKGWNSFKLERVYSISKTHTIDYSLEFSEEGGFTIRTNFDYKCGDDLNKTTRENLGINIDEEYRKCQEIARDLSTKYEM